MKKFFLMVLLASVFFTGLGSMIQETRAKFKSDEKALALLAKARQAIGGDNSIAAVNSLIVTGKSTRTFKHDGAEVSHQGNMELAFQFPDKMMKTVTMGHGESANGEKSISKQIDVMVVKSGEGHGDWKAEDGHVINLEGGKKMVFKKDDGTVQELKTAGGENVIVKSIDNTGGGQGEAKNGEKQFTFTREAKGGTPGEFPWQLSGLARTTLSLLLTAPQGMDVSYLYGGEGNVDGTACNIIDARFSAGSVKLYLGKDSNLPVMISYQDAKPMVMWFKKADAEAPMAEKNVKVFERHAAAAPELAEFQIRFSDYRSTNGVLLPYKWVQTVGGQPDETIEVSSYEINSANIADKFKAGDTKVFVRKAKEASN